MISAIIIDDEPQSAFTLQKDLESHCPYVQLLASCHSAKEGLLLIKSRKPDLIFLDIEMPWMNGFEMLEVIGPIDFSIIFTTAYDQFAARAFRLSAVDYLLKPVDTDELCLAVQKAIIRMEHQHGYDNIENLLLNLKQPSIQQRIALPYKEGFEFIEVSRIVYCSAEGAYTRVLLDDRKKILVSKSLGDIEELLPPTIFQRIHHSTIVNINFVTHFLKTDGGYLKMLTGEELSVSKSKKELVLERLGLNKS